MSKTCCFLVAAVLIGALASASSAQGRGALTEGQQSVKASEPASDAFTENLIGYLEQSGFKVSEGSPKLYTFEDCVNHTYPALNSCFLANPAAPYVIPVVKSWPEEYVDPELLNPFVEAEPGYSAIYRLDPREAIVMFGRMPPPGRYMGLQTFEFSQHGKWRAKDYNHWANTQNLPFAMPFLFDTLPSGVPPQRVISISAIGDIVNNVVMEEKSGYPFGETRYFIITPSDTTDQAVRIALQAQGVSDDHVFTQQIPREDQFGPIGPLGMGENAIDFVTMFRYAVPDDQNAAKKWRHDLPLTVLRVRAPASVGPVRRYGSLTFESRAANSETGLSDSLNHLASTVCDTVGNHAGLTSADCIDPAPVSSYMLEMTHNLGWVGPYCRNIGMNCNADQNDMALYLSSSPQPLGNGQVIAVLGTLATETDNATYVGLAANDASMMAGVANVLDTDLSADDGSVIKGLKGSAESYGVENSGKLFVHYFSEDCAILKDPVLIEQCTPTHGVQPALGDPALQGMFTITLRNYIVPGTKRGADPSKLVTPRILTFRRQ